MISHYIITNRELTSRKSANSISVNENEFMRMDGFSSDSAKVVEYFNSVLNGGNSAGKP